MTELTFWIIIAAMGYMIYNWAKGSPRSEPTPVMSAGPSEEDIAAWKAEAKKLAEGRKPTDPSKLSEKDRRTYELLRVASARNRAIQDGWVPSVRGERPPEKYYAS